MTTKIIQDNVISDFLNTTLVDMKWFIFDYWMLVHLTSGLILGYLIKDWKVVFGLLILYEVFEWLLWGVAFKPEPLINVIWDIIFGMVGFALMKYFMGLKSI